MKSEQNRDRGIGNRLLNGARISPASFSEALFAVARLGMVLLVAGICLGGCGYTLQGSGSILPPDVKRVYIPRVENTTTELALTDLLTESLRDRFDRYGAVTVVENLGEADAVLKARVLKVRRATGSVVSNTDTALQLDTSVSIAAELRRVTGPVLWRDLNVVVTRAYGSEQSVVITSSPGFAGSTLSAGNLSALSQGGSREVARGQEEEAFASIAEEISQIVYDGAVSPDF